MILVRPFTEADDVAGFHAAKGILTAEGGKRATRRSWRADGQAVRVRRGGLGNRPPREDASA